MKEEPKTYAYRWAKLVAVELFPLLLPACHRLEIAGSVRRANSQSVHDLDIVAWPVYADQEYPTLFGGPEVLPGPPRLLVEAIRRTAGNHSPVDKDTRIVKFIYKQIPVEVYLAEHDGANFGALWQMRTGGEEFNRRLVRRAWDLGLTYKAGYGIFRGEERIDDDSEPGIFAALGLQYMEPSKRRGDALFPLLQTNGKP